jgi:hypothetical protein
MRNRATNFSPFENDKYKFFFRTRWRRWWWFWWFWRVWGVQAANVTGADATDDGGTTTVPKLPLLTP